MKIGIIKYNAGNTQSVKLALNRLGVEPIISDDKEVLLSLDKLVFPGVGEASTAMSYLKERGLDVLLKNLKQPTLGICLGLQLMCQHSEENDTECLGIFDTNVKRFSKELNLKIPHMGWNDLKNMSGKLCEGIDALPSRYAYFVHSYYAEVCAETIATCNYGLDFSAIMAKDNFYATQFHPEKSGVVGEQILKNFLDL